MDLSSRRSTPATAAGHTTKERGRRAGRHSQGLWRRLGVASLIASALVSTSLAVAPSAGAVPATTRWVNATGTASAPGTSCAAPGYNTITAAITAATAGDTIQVCAGTYAENLAINKSLTLLGPNESVAALSGTSRSAEAIVGANNTANRVSITGASTVEIAGFTFVGTATGTGSPGISVAGGGSGTIRNNWFDSLANPSGSSFSNADIYIQNGNAGTYTISGNRFDGPTGTDPGDGPYSYSAINPWYLDDVTITGNRIENYPFSGMQLEGTKKATITGNYVKNVAANGIQIANGASVGPMLVNGNTVDHASAAYESYYTPSPIDADYCWAGIRIWQSNTSAAGVTEVSNNKIINTPARCGAIGLTGRSVQTVAKIENNSIDNTNSDGLVWINYAARAVETTSNVATIRLWSEPSDITVGGSVVVTGLGAPFDGTHTVTATGTWLDPYNYPYKTVSFAVTAADQATTDVTSGNVVPASRAAAPIPATNNWWGSAAGPNTTGASLNSAGAGATTTPWIHTYTDDPAKAGQPGFWPTNIVEGFPTGAPVPTDTGTGVEQSFYNAGTEAGSITFGTVATAGDTTVTPKSSGDPGYITPSGFSLGTTPTYYDISTTAAFTGNITICLAYKPADFPVGATPQILHYSSGAWADVTSSVDTTNLVVCGIVTSLSPFALGTGAITIHAADQTKVYDGTTDVTASPSVDGSTPLPSGSTIGDCTQSFGSKNVGTGKAITISDCKVYNAADVDVTASYDITYSDGTGTITKAGLTINAVAATKTYDGTTASSATPTYTSVFSPDTVSGLTQVFDAAAVGPRTLSVNAYTVNDGNSGANYAVTTNTAAGTITPYLAPTTVTYLGPIVDADGNGSTTFSAQLSSGSPACVSGQTITFSLDGTPIGSGTTNSSGIATYTRTLAIGTYTLLADYAGTGSCAAGFSDNNIVTVADPAGKANGGGSYTVTGVTGRINFGFNVKTTVNKKTGATTVAGDLTWTVDKTTRLRSKSVTSITNLTCPTGYAKCTTFAGTGELSTWIPDVTKRGGGSWSAPTIVTFTAKAYDGGVLTTCVGKKCTNTDKPDAFGMDIVGRTVAGESTPLNITKGNIKVT